MNRPILRKFSAGIPPILLLLSATPTQAARLQPAQPARVRDREVVPRRAGPVSAVVAIARTAPVLPALEAADTAARNAELAYNSHRSQVAAQVARRVGRGAKPEAIRAALRPHERALERSARRYANAEVAFTIARNRVWKSLRASRQLPVFVNEPLNLALFDLHAELRRKFGPTGHTRVAGLARDKGCAGDLIADRLVYGYGKAITSLSSSTEAHAAALGRIATQIACLSSMQLSHLESALSLGHERVAQRLVAIGWGDLVPAFSRYVAPLQVLILDARKHRGTRSRAWQWFVKHRVVLTDEVRRLGWPGGTLWLWDRLAGRMVGYPKCQASGLRGDCFDPVAFIESLLDPRALGRGDCALSAMVSRGTTQLPAGQALYTCPSLPCEGSQPPDAPGAPGLRPATGAASVRPAITLGRMTTPAEQNNLPWPQLTQADIGVMRGFCVGADGGSRLQGDEAGDCLFANQSKNPFDNHLRCVAEGLAGEPPEVGEFGGVPMSPQCKFASGDGEESGEEEESPTQPAPEPEPEAQPEEDSLFDTIGDILVEISNTVVELVGGRARGVAGEVAGEVSGIALDLLSEEGAAAELGLGQMLAELALRGAWMEGRVSDKEYNDWHGKKPADIVEFLNGKRGAQGCLDSLDCSNSCTGLGQSLATARACNSALLNDLLTAAGRPDRSRPGKRLDWVSNWAPDQGPVPETETNFCLPGGGSTGPERGPIACGLVLCPEGTASASAMGQCCGSRFGNVSVILMKANCAAIRCPDGAPVVDASGACRCATAEPPPGGPRPRPLPERRRPPTP